MPLIHCDHKMLLDMHLLFLCNLQYNGDGVSV